ncbi:hypothetical protein [Phormidesmis priestleyi]
MRISLVDDRAIALQAASGKTKRSPILNLTDKNQKCCDSGNF